MNKSKLKRIRLVNFMMIVWILSRSAFSYAITSSELNQMQKDIDTQINETNSEIAGVKSQMTDALNRIVELNSEITTYENDIHKLENEINSFNSQISEKESKITEQEEKYRKQKELLDKRLVALYESGTISYLDMLLSSENLSDFISKYYIISELAEFDEELLEEIQNAKEQIITERESLEVMKINVENTKTEIENKKNSLTVSINSKKTLVSNLSQEEAELQEKLEEMEEDKREIQEKLLKIVAEEEAKEKKNAKTSTNTKTNTSNQTYSPNTYGYIFPVSGCSKSNINNLSYPSYTGHTGVDININVVGKNVVAVKSGTVEISTAKKNKDGSYRSYGEYVVINHHDGTMTLYAHMLENSRKVKSGDEVFQGQVIGTVGNTGNSKGTHLHFEVRIKGIPVNPIPYMP